MTVCGCFVALSILMVFVVHKNKHWLLAEYLGGNPYLLTWRVVKFADQHNNPIRRSALTYCESDYPTRLDFGKQRYGGPIATEQVEDVKTLLNILIVLLCLGPVFFFEQGTIYIRQEYLKPFSSNIWKEQLYIGIPSVALVVIFVTLLMKCFMCRCFPSVFKRMGFSVACLLLTLLVYVLYNTLITGDFINCGSYSVYCNNGTQVSDYYILPSAISILSLENVGYFIYRLLLYISVWEFICCLQFKFSTSYWQVSIFGYLPKS